MSRKGQVKRIGREATKLVRRGPGAGADLREGTPEPGSRAGLGEWPPGVHPGVGVRNFGRVPVQPG